MEQLRKFKPNYFFTGIITTAFLILTLESASQVTPRREIIRPLTNADTVKPRTNVDTTSGVVITANDTIPARVDTIVAPDTTTFQDTTITITDSISVQRVDTFSLKLSKDTLDAPVRYQAQDSVVVLVQDGKVLLYGQTTTEYKDITLNAPTVEIDQETQILTAINKRDSTGQVIEEAHFAQGTDDNRNEFTSDTIRYNFKTGIGLTKNTITQSGEMVVHGETIKKMNNAITYIRGALFTTCNLDVPHFAFKTNKMKVVSEKVAVSGPTHPEFEGVPVPVYLPFGFFPLSQGRRSGLLPPQFATNEQFGLGLEGLGYYKVMNQYWDIKFYGNIYSYGGWSANVNPTYRKRYRYSGAFNIGVMQTKMNFKGDPDFLKNMTYTLTWNHNMDNRARPGTNFSANVNMSSTAHNRYVPNSPQVNFQNMLSSSITYSKSWEGKPYNLTMSANHHQNNQTRLVNLNLPDVGFSVSTLYPFRKPDAPANKWYDQLGIAYQGNFRNQVSFYDTAFQFKRLIDTLQWGAQHNLPVTLALPPILGGAIVVSPNVSYSQVWIAQKFRRTWNDVERKVDTTITKGFFVDHRASAGISFNTSIFGTYEFRRSKVVAIRHVVRPSVSVNYQPDLSRKHYYDVQLDTTGDFFGRFSEFEGALYPGYSEGRFGGLSFQLDNNLEMKVRTKDTTAGNSTRKVRLIDGFGLSFSYNFFADSMRLTPANLYFRTNLFDKINITAGAILNPYKTDSRGRPINQYVWSDGFNLGRVTSANISISTSFQSKPKDPAKEEAKQQELNDLRNDPVLIADQQRLLDYMRQNPAEFVDFNIPWSFSISYSLLMTQQFRPDYSEFEKVINSSASFSGNFNLSPKWNFSMNGFFDFDTKQLQTFSMSIARDMHCWQMSINVAPIGLYRYFSFTISPKAGILQDLRINRTRSFFTGF